MAKRFIDTGLFDDPWFMDLSKDCKIAWVFLITKCDHAGIIQINERLFKVMTGVNSFATVQQELNGRLVQLRDSYFFIPKFIYYQYPGFPKSQVNAQMGAIKRLCEFGLYDSETGGLNEQFTNSSLRDGEGLTNSYGYGNGNGNGKETPIEKKSKKEEVKFEKIKHLSDFYSQQIAIGKAYVEKIPESLDDFNQYRKFITYLHDYNNIENYDPLGESLASPKENLLKLPKQMRFIDFVARLREAQKYGVNIFDKLDAMENSGSLKGKTDFNLTLSTFLKPFSKPKEA